MCRNCWKPAYDVIIVDLDSDPEHALDLVEQYLRQQLRNRDGLFLAAPIRSCWCAACGPAPANFSPSPSPQHHCGGPGSRLGPAARPFAPPKKTVGKVFVFAGAKGGSGVTTIASNFAILLAQESHQNTVLRRSRSSPWRCGLGPRNHHSVLHRQCASELQPARFQLPLQAPDQTQFRAVRALGSRQIHSAPRYPMKRSQSCWPLPGRTSITWWSMLDRAWAPPTRLSWRRPRSSISSLRSASPSCATQIA